MAAKRKSEEIGSLSDVVQAKNQMTDPSSVYFGGESSSFANKKFEVDSGKNSTQSNDEAYFRAYADLLVHQDMIDDNIRTNTYRHAILQNYKLFYNKIVLDVGCGTGILSLFCIQAGAKKVYAVDASSIIEQARQVIQSNNAAGKIILIQGKIEEIELPEKVDIIVSEWMGYMMLFESMLSSVLYARDKWLKKNGTMFPNDATMFMAPVTDNDTFNERVNFWAMCKERYKVDLSVLSSYAKQKLIETVQIHSVCAEDVQAHATMLKHFDLLRITKEEALMIRSKFDFDCFGHSTIHGFAVWFSVAFPGDFILSTSPYASETHWQQTLLFINPFDVEQDTRICGMFSVSPTTMNPRFLNIMLEYQVNDDNVREYKYHMTDTIF